MEALILEECKNQLQFASEIIFIRKGALTHEPMSVIHFLLGYRLLSNSLLKTNSCLKKSVASL